MFPGEDDEDLDGNRPSGLRHSNVSKAKSRKYSSAAGDDEEGFESELVGHSEQILGEINQIPHMMNDNADPRQRRENRVQHSPPNMGGTSARRYPDKSVVNLGESFMQPLNQDHYAPLGAQPQVDGGHMRGVGGASESLLGASSASPNMMMGAGHQSQYM